MRPRRDLSSWLAPYFERFIALKRAGGARYESQVLLLCAFDRYLHAHVPEPPLSREQFLSYVQTLARLSDRGRDNALSVVWPAISYAALHGAPVEPPPRRPARPSRLLRLRLPRILSETEFRNIIAAARRLPPANLLRPATYATLFGLLYTTGIRIGEARALNVGDLDLRSGLLTIRRGKFGKSRVLPLQRSTVEALDRYLRDECRPLGTTGSDPFFVSGRRRRPSHAAAATAFRTAVSMAGISAPHPRLHDLRHTFAVHRVLDWYAQGRDVNALLPVLSTYLGHVSVENTRIYLRANGLLLEQAASCFEAKTKALDQEVSS